MIGTSLSLATHAPVHAETLADAIALAYQSSPTLQGQRYDLRAADEDIAVARSELRATVNAQVTGVYDRTVEGRASQAADPFNPEASNANSATAQLVADQPLYTGGHATADRQQAEATDRSVRETLRGTEGDLLLKVISAYLDVRKYAASVAIWNENVGELTKLAKEVDARRIAGELTQTDVAQAHAQLEIARAQAVDAEQNLQDARADYAALIGHIPAALDPPPALPAVPSNLGDAYDMAERQNPELAAARYTELASKDAIVAARASGRPTIHLRGTASVNGQALPYRLGEQDQNFTGAVVLSWPLIAGGRTNALIHQAEDRDGSDLFKVEAARREASRQIANAWNRVVATEREKKMQIRQREAAAIQLDGMINEYRVGLRSTFDVLYAEQSLRDSELSLLASARDNYVAQATLLRQAGLLEARTLLVGLNMANPDTHLRQAERRSALPWDGPVAAIDGFAKPSSHRPPLAEPAPSPAATVAKAPSGSPGDADFATFVPVAPTAAADHEQPGRATKGHR